jgi:hypothetical protein
MSHNHDPHNHDPHQTDSNPSPLALFRLFTIGNIEPTILELPARTFANTIRYDGRLFIHTGRTPAFEIPPGYDSRVVCSWEFMEFLPTAINDEPIVEHCIVCGAPAPLHTIRCGTAA